MGRPSVGIEPAERQDGISQVALPKIHFFNFGENIFDTCARTPRSRFATPQTCYKILKIIICLNPEKVTQNGLVLRPI